jgi:hypothetical protein
MLQARRKIGGLVLFVRCSKERVIFVSRLSAEFPDYSSLIGIDERCRSMAQSIRFLPRSSSHRGNLCPPMTASSSRRVDMVAVNRYDWRESANWEGTPMPDALDELEGRINQIRSEIASLQSQLEPLERAAELIRPIYRFTLVSNHSVKPPPTVRPEALNATHVTGDLTGFTILEAMPVS